MSRAVAPFDLIASRYDSVEPKVFSWAATETAKRANPRLGEIWLDIGSGPGDALVVRAGTSRLAIGLDISVEMLRRARTHALEAAGRFVAGDVRSLPFRPQSVDVITASSVLGFLCDDGSHWSELARIAGAKARCVASFWRPVADPTWQWLTDTSVTSTPTRDIDEQHFASTKLRETGFTCRAVNRIERSFQFRTFEHYVRWQLANGLGLALQLAGPTVRKDFFQHATRELRPLFARGPVGRRFRFNIVSYVKDG